MDNDKISIFEGDCWQGTIAPTPPAGALEHGVQAGDIYVGAVDLPYDGIDANCDGKDDFDADGDGFVPTEYQGIVTIGLPGTGALPAGDCLDDPSLQPDTLDAALIYPDAEDEWYDGIDADCAGDSDFDADGDGFDSSNHEQPDGSVGEDCNDENLDINPDAEDVPLDAIDSDCNGKEICYEDLDGDGVGTSNYFESESPDCSAAGVSSRNDDCDDTNPDISPEEEELIADGIDSNCDEIELCFEDIDGDGFGTATIESSDITCSSAGLSTFDTDCNDQEETIYPDAPELAGDAVDQNCDAFEDCYEDLDEDGYRSDEIVQTVNIDCSGATESLAGTLDLDCDDTSAQTYPGAAFNESQTCMLDADGDGYGSASVTGGVNPGGDCNDSNPAISPAATEICDGIDNDCDSLLEEEDPSLDTTTAIMYYDDQDGDGYGGSVGDYYCTQPSGFVTNSDDCNDSDDSINPTTIWYEDADGDSYGLSSSTLTQCAQPSGYVRDDTDCNDIESTVNPSVLEISGDGVDQNCDGFEECYEDLDEDGYRTGTINLSSNIDCSGTGEALTSTGLLDCDDSSAQTYPGAGYNETLPNLCRTDVDGDGYGEDSPIGTVRVGTDCNDNNPDISPAASEVCDGGVDNDCDTLVDEDDDSLDVSTSSLLYTDDDGDGYGDPAQSGYYCIASAGLVTNDDDCDDGNGAINPDTVWYEDYDQDGFGVSSSILTQCGQPNGYVLLGGDCNDVSSQIKPSATEITGDGVDQNCDGIERCYEDLDNDGFRTTTEVTSSDSDCGDSGEALTSAGIDCNDSVFAINPNAIEVCDGDDNDCDTRVDEDDNSLDTSTATLYFLDDDGDGYGSTTAEYRCSSQSGWVTNDDDCDDTKILVNPGATEIAGDGFDQNCDNYEVCFVDGDNDGYGGTNETTSFWGDLSCGANLVSLNSDDCDDTDVNTNPAASDTVGNGIDENCDFVDGVDNDDDGFASQGSGGDDCDDGNGDVYPFADEYPGSIDFNCDGFESVDDDCFGFVELGIYYLHCESAVSWSRARERCEDNGYEMVSIRNDDENDAVFDMISANTWIGYKDTDTSYSQCFLYIVEDVRFTWTDGYSGYYDINSGCISSSASSSGYNHWNSGEPNNSDNSENCAEIYHTNGRWNDSTCSSNRHYICTSR